MTRIITVPLLVTIEPSDMSNQEKKSFQTVESKMNRADKRKADQKARKAAGKAKGRSLKYTFFIREDNFHVVYAELLQSMP